MRELAVEPLTAAAFAPFGDVIEPASAKATYAINDGTATRYHDLARIDTAAGDGRTVVSIFRAQPRAFPFAVEMLERHPLGSQAFVPMGPAPYLVVVGTGAGDVPRAFLARDGQGVNFHRGTWHHPLLALERESAFLVIDRDGPGGNCDEIRLVEPYRILSPA
jgi:ureidoglycolate lyase